MNVEPTDLEVLLPGQDVQVNGETVRVLPLYFGQYPKAIKLIRPLATVVQQSGAFGVKQVSNADGKPVLAFSMADDWLAALPLVLEEGGEALINFFAFAINKPRAWFDTVPGDEGFKLAHAILKENQDFFVRKILPLFAELGWTKMVQTEKDGEQSLQPSTATDTVGMTSS